MSTSGFTNLDLVCSQQAKKLAQTSDKALYKLITTALGVLEEQGVYALFLFLQSAKNDNATKIKQNLYALLNNPAVGLAEGNNLEAVEVLADTLDKLLLAQDMLRQTLVYARYHAKNDEENNNSEEPA